jgi:para-aminobenzoate synthetase component 1
MADPYDWVRVGSDEWSENGSLAEVGKRSCIDPLTELSIKLQRHSSVSVAELPPFQGGAAGLFSYELGRTWERLPWVEFDEFQIPNLLVGVYDFVVAFDHLEQGAWIISQGTPELEPERRKVRAEARGRQVWQWLSSRDSADLAAKNPLPLRQGEERRVMAPMRQLPDRPGLFSNFSPEEYCEAVARALEYIRAGDIFQVNLSQRLMMRAAEGSVDTYLRLRQRTPAPFGAYFDAGDFQLLSASPERFVSVHEGEVQARPIKGTRRRTLQPEADLFAGDELLCSDKDRAENVMIADLLRNDLSRVCLPDSVYVPQLCGLESYGYVQHLVSVVRGQLRPGMTAVDVVRAAFPGGSITGAPKVRAMEIITELERVARGAYCGSLGYIGYDGAMDLSILIRTMTVAGGWWQFPVGGGVVADSIPEAEYQETWHKAAGIMAALDAGDIR